MLPRLISSPLRAVLLLIGIVLLHSSLRAAYTPPPAASLELNFNPGWRVAQGSFPVDGVDDSGWERVSTPHTYHERQAYQGLKKGLRDLGAFTHRMHFTVPADYAGRKLVIEFQVKYIPVAISYEEP
jgi:beta-galactosidase